MERAEINRLWLSNDEQCWKEQLAAYWTQVKPANLALEKDLCELSAQVKVFEDIYTVDNDWYTFLLGKYFRWKYTAPNRLATTTNAFKKAYAADQQLLNKKIARIFSCDKNDIKENLIAATQISGLGPAGASGLIALLFPKHFGTVDQFVVSGLSKIADLPENELIRAMKPEQLTVNQGVFLIQVMREKSAALNQLFGGDRWTPRHIDMILWSCRESG